MIAPSPPRFARHLSPASRGRGTQVLPQHFQTFRDFEKKTSQNEGSSPPQSGGEVARAKPETERGTPDMPSRRSPERIARARALRHGDNPANSSS